MKALIVDDIKENVFLLSEMLSVLDCECDYAENGEEAVAKAGKFVYDVIFMDVEMPVMNGFEALEEIRTVLAPPFSQIPIVAISAHNGAQFDEMRVRCGMSDYIAKPYTMTKIKMLLVKHCGCTA